MSNVKKYTDKLDQLKFDNMYNGDFFLTWEKTDDEIAAVFTVADALRHLRENNISTKIFDSGLGISLFRDNSTRTRFSFASACNLLGIEVQDLDEGKSQIAHGETVRETANMISFMADVIGIRDDMYIGKGNTYMHNVVNAVTEGNKAGVLEQKPTLVNLQCDIDHPTQCMADMLHCIHTLGGSDDLDEAIKNLKGKKVAMTWAYSPSYGKPLSVPQGVAGLFTRFGMDVTLAYPEGYEIMDDVVKVAEENCKKSGAKFTITHDMKEAFRRQVHHHPRHEGSLQGRRHRLPQVLGPLQGHGGAHRALWEGRSRGHQGSRKAAPRSECGTQGLGVHRGDDEAHEGRQGPVPPLPARGHH